MAKRRQNPEFQPVRITSPVTAPVSQFYDPSALAQAQDFQNSMEIAKAFSELSSSLAGFAKTYTKAEIRAGEEEFAQLASSPQKLRAKATEYIESAGRLAPWRVRSFLEMYGGQTYGSQYRSSAFADIDSLSEPMNPDGTIKTDQQIQSQLNRFADQLEVPDSYYVRRGFNKARLGVDNEVMSRIGQLRVAKAKQATEDQAAAEALQLITNTRDPEQISKGLDKILKGTHASGLGLTSGGRQAVVRAVIQAVDRELNSADPDFSRVDEILSVFSDGEVAGLKLTPELIASLQDVQNKSDKALRFTAFSNQTNEIALRLNPAMTDAVGQAIKENNGQPISPDQMNAIALSLIREQNPETPSDVVGASRELLRRHGLTVQEEYTTFRNRQTDDPETIVAIEDQVRSYAPDALNTVRNAYTTGLITRQTYDRFVTELNNSHASFVRDAAPFINREMSSADVVSPSVKSTLTTEESASLDQRLQTERDRILIRTAATVARSPAFREAMSRGDEFTAQQMLTQAAVSEWNSSRERLIAEVASIQESSFSNLQAVARGRAITVINDAVSSVYPEDSMAGGVGLTAELRAQQRELREYLIKHVESGVISTASVVGRDKVNPYTFDDAWIRSTIDDGIDSYTSQKVGAGKKVGEYAKAPTITSQMPVGREDDWTLLITQDAANRGEVGELEARRRLEEGALEAVARINNKVNNERNAPFLTDYPIDGVFRESNRSAKITFTLGGRRFIETNRGVVVTATPGLLSGGRVDMSVPYSVEDWNALSQNRKNVVLTELLAARSEVDQEATYNRVFDLGMIGFDINQLTFSKIGAMDVSSGKPFESNSDPFAIDLKLGPPNPKVFLYGTPEQWAQMNSDYSDYEQIGQIPPGPLQDLLDLFENSYTPEQIMLLQGGLRVNRGLEPRK